MYSKGGKIEIMTYDNANEVIKEIFESIPFRHQIGLEASMKGKNFIFDGVSCLVLPY